MYQHTIGVFVVESADGQLSTGESACFVIAADLVHLSDGQPESKNSVSCQLISEEFVVSMVTLFLESASGHEFNVQMQERELSKLELDLARPIWLSWSERSVHVLGA